MADLQQLLRSGLRVVLVNPIHPGNVGATARAMKNSGLRQLVVVSPLQFDMERARWMAGGGRDVLDEAHFVSTVAEAVSDCQFAIGCTARARPCTPREAAHSHVTAGARRRRPLQSPTSVRSLARISSILHLLQSLSSRTHSVTNTSAYRARNLPVPLT